MLPWTLAHTFAGALAAALFAGAAALAAQGRDSAAAARPATMVGTVSDSAGTPLPGVTVTAADGATTSTDSLGGFRLAGLAPGRQRFLARRLGFAPARFDLALAPDSTVHVALRLGRAAVVLGTVVVVDGRAPDGRLLAEGFYNRRRTALGHFITPEQLGGRRMTHPSALFRNVPSVSVRRGGLGQTMLMTRGTAGDCQMDVWVDGYYTPLMASLSFDEVVSMDQVTAAEVYRTWRDVPQRFQRPGADCGAVVVWTVAPGAP